FLPDPALAGLLSTEGVIPHPRFVTNTSGAGVSPAKGASRPRSDERGRAALVGRRDARPTTTTTNRFGERLTSLTLDPDVRVLIDTPPENISSAQKKVLLLLYALPNGNTIEQTVGRALKPGDDWHY